jgi:hypothetical protein
MSPLSSNRSAIPTRNDCDNKRTPWNLHPDQDRMMRYQSKACVHAHEFTAYRICKGRCRGPILRASRRRYGCRVTRAPRPTVPGTRSARIRRAMTRMGPRTDTYTQRTGGWSRDSPQKSGMRAQRPTQRNGASIVRECAGHDAKIPMTARFFCILQASMSRSGGVPGPILPSCALFRCRRRQKV